MANATMIERSERLRTRRVGRTTLVVCLLILCVSVALGLSLAWPWARSYVQSVALLMQLNGEPLPSILRPIAGKEIAIRNITIPSPQGAIPARLYIPVGVSHPPGLVLVQGLTYQGIDQTSFRRYARLEAACGLLVLTPDVSALRQYRLDPAAIDTIGESAKWLARRQGSPVALMGISFSGGLALMVAARPEYAPSIKMVFDLGGYDDLIRLTNFYLTGEEPRPDGSLDREKRSRFGLLVMAYALQSVSLPATDRDALYAVLLATLYRKPRKLPGVEAKLTPTQRAEWNSIVEGQGNERDLKKLEARNQALRALSPHGHLQGIGVPVFLLHGTNDSIVPSAEAQWTARDLPPGTLKRMLISPIVGHVSLNGKSIVWMDKWRLVHFTAAELRAVQKR